MAVQPSYPVDVKQNPSWDFTWTAGKLTQVDMIVDGETWRRTLTWSGDELDTVSAWVKQ